MNYSIVFVLITIGCAVALPSTIFSNLRGNKQVNKDQIQHNSVAPTQPPHTSPTRLPYRPQGITFPKPTLREALIIAAGAAITKFVTRLPKTINGELQINDDISTTSTTTLSDEEIEDYIKTFEFDHQQFDSLN